DRTDICLDPIRELPTMNTMNRTLMLRLAAGLVLGCTPALTFASDDCGHEGCLHFKLAMARMQARAFDPETGRDLLNYPRDRVVDHQHMKLVIDIPDMNVPRASAVQTLTVNAIGAPVQQLTLDAKLLEIKGLESPGRTVRHQHDG